MSSQTQTHQLVTEGAIPSEITQLQLNLVGEANTPHPVDTEDPSATTSTVPVAESRGLPLRPLDVHDPPNWPTYRGVPHYIPYEEHIDITDRPLGQNGGEFGFLLFMLSGVQIVSSGNNIWRSTVGRLTDEVFKYKIGGHW